MQSKAAVVMDNEVDKVGTLEEPYVSYIEDLWCDSGIQVSLSFLLGLFDDFHYRNTPLL
jgi:hypothetical protein